MFIYFLCSLFRKLIAYFINNCALLDFEPLRAHAEIGLAVSINEKVSTLEKAFDTVNNRLAHVRQQLRRFPQLRCAFVTCEHVN